MMHTVRKMIYKWNTTIHTNLAQIFVVCLLLYELTRSAMADLLVDEIKGKPQKFRVILVWIVSYI